jgi:hypothetical protein
MKLPLQVLAISLHLPYSVHLARTESLCLAPMALDEGFEVQFRLHLFSSKLSRQLFKSGPD